MISNRTQVATKLFLQLGDKELFPLHFLTAIGPVIFSVIGYFELLKIKDP